MSKLFSPINIGKLRLPNRIVIPPMCQYSAKDGVAGDWYAMHLGQLATSGAGLFIIEATGVCPEARITPGDLGLYNDASEDALTGLIRAIKSYSDMPLAIQLGHAGRKASSDLPWYGGSQLSLEAGGWQTVSASALPFATTDRPPLALDEQGLQQVREAFAQAARRAARCGLDAIEIHSAHGYLLHQFLSPLSNQRTDSYGGSLENRLRFPLEVFDAVRAAFPADKPVGIRISATDWVEGGWDPDQSLVFAKALQAGGCAFLHVSSGGLSALQKIELSPGYQVPLAEGLRSQLDMPVIAVGLISEPEHAERIVANGQADLVALGRTLLYNPHWPWHAAAKLGAQLSVPPQYWRSQPAGLKTLFGDTSPRKR